MKVQQTHALPVVIFDTAIACFAWVGQWWCVWVASVAWVGVAFVAGVAGVAFVGVAFVGGWVRPDALNLS